MALQFNRSNNGTNQNMNNQQSQQQPMWGNRQNVATNPFQRQGNMQNQSGQQQPQRGYQNQFAQQSPQGGRQNQQQQGGRQNQSMQQQGGWQNQSGQQQQGGRQNQFGQQQQQQGGMQSQSGQQQPPSQGFQQNPFAQPLPDGVTLQPLDENLLREINNLKQNPPPAPSLETPEIQLSPVEQGASVPMGFKVDDLEPFIQDEQNGSRFYQYLAEESSREDHRDILSMISNSCTRRNNVYNEIYQQHKGKQFETREANINNVVGFDEGIRLAIHEESKSLRELSDIYEQVADDRISKSLNSQLYKKVSDLSFLHLIKNDSGRNHRGLGWNGE